jgi:hypothetical protein
MKAEHILSTPTTPETGKANVEPDAVYCRVASLDKVESKKIENFVTNDFSLDNPVLNLRDQSDPLNSFYGTPEKLKVEVGDDSLYVRLKDMDFFENKKTEKEKALITCPGFKLNDFNYVDYKEALKYISRFNDKAYANIKANIDPSKVDHVCKDALEHNSDFALFNWGNRNFIECLKSSSLKTLNVIGAPDCMAEWLIKSYPSRYNLDLKDLKFQLGNKNVLKVSMILKSLVTKFLDDLEKMDYTLDKDLPELDSEFKKSCLDNSITLLQTKTDTFNEDRFKTLIKAFALKKLMFKDENKVYNFFETIENDLFETFKINSKSKTADYQRELRDLMLTSRKDYNTTLRNLSTFFSFKIKFRETNGRDKLFKKLIYD